MAHVHEWEDYLDLNYFICTLGLAAAVNNDHPQPFKNVNDFIDHQAQRFPTRPAVGFPIPQRNEGEQWGQTLYSKSPCCSTHDVVLDGGYLASCGMSFSIPSNKTCRVLSFLHNAYACFGSDTRACLRPAVPASPDSYTYRSQLAHQ